MPLQRLHFGRKEMSEQKGPRGVDPKVLFMLKKEKVNTSSSLAGDNRIFLLPKEEK